MLVQNSGFCLVDIFFESLKYENKLHKDPINHSKCWNIKPNKLWIPQQLFPHLSVHSKLATNLLVECQLCANANAKMSHNDYIFSLFLSFTLLAVFVFLSDS